MTHENRIPFYKPAGKLIYFEKSVLLEWIRSNRIMSEAEIQEEARSNMGNNVKYLRDWFFKHNMEPEGNQCKEILDGLSRVLDEARHRRQLADEENAEARTVPDNRTNAL